MVSSNKGCVYGFMSRLRIGKKGRKRGRGREGEGNGGGGGEGEQTARQPLLHGAAWVVVTAGGTTCLDPSFKEMYLLRFCSFSHLV